MSAAATQTTPALSAAAPARGATSVRWLIGARQDLAWFICPALVCYLMYGLVAWRLVPVYVLLTAWLVLGDTPHVFGTLTRTYFDREERRGRGRLLWGSLALLGVGPALVAAGQGAAFILLVGLWSHLHQIKQHYGFAVLYKKKNDDLRPADNALDQLFMRFGFGFPIADFLMRQPWVVKRLPESLTALLPSVRAALLFLTLAVVLAWLARQAQRVWTGPALNVPKCLLLLAALPLHWLVLLSPATPQSIAVVVGVLSPFHTLQYHRLVWFHNRKYTRDNSCRERHGAAALLNRRLVYYAAFVLGVSLFYHAVRLGAGRVGGRGVFWTEMLLAFMLGHLLVHFYLDSKIWRVRRDPLVGSALALDEGRPDSGAAPLGAVNRCPPTL
jgi:hypothetical protein